jgi:hypothetical protein
MAFKRLGPIVKQVVSRLVIDAGEGSGETLPDAVEMRKGAGANAAPASECQGDTTLPVQEEDTDKERRIALASQAGMGRPSPAVRRSLFVVVEGGRPAGSGGLSRAAYAQARGGNLASNSLRLVR